MKGVVTYINYTDGYFRINGNTNDASTGVMVRLNDPESRHTVQQGSGVLLVLPTVARTLVSRLTRTTTQTFLRPACLAVFQARSARTFVDTIDVDADLNTTETLTAQSTATGTGDLLCPSTNRTANLIVADSRRFAPIQVGDSIEVEGNFETISGVRFISAHSTMVMRALATRNVAGQPDYMFLNEVGVDAPGFQNQRARTLFIGFASLNTDVMIWSLHYDHANNEAHEFPLATVVGCDNAAGAGTCGQNGLVAGVGGNIWKIRHDVDFEDPATTPRLDPCAHLRADPRFSASNPCPGGGTFAEQFAILSPIHARFRRERAASSPIRRALSRRSTSEETKRRTASTSSRSALVLAVSSRQSSTKSTSMRCKRLTASRAFPGCLIGDSAPVVVSATARRRATAQSIPV